MSKIYCRRHSCQYCFGGVCGKETVKINSDGCQSFRGIEGWKNNPYDDYFRKSTEEDFMKQWKQRTRLFTEEAKVRIDDVNQDT